MRGERLERQPEHVGGHLLPEPRPGAAVRDADATGHLAELGEDVEVVAEPERDPLQDRAEQVPRVVASDSPTNAPRASGSWSGVFSPEQVRERHDAAGARARRPRPRRRARASDSPPASLAWNQRMKLPDAAMQPFGRYRPGTRWKSR